jgi:hypothetical protein
MEGKKFGLKVMVISIVINHALCQSVSHMEPYSHHELNKRAGELDSDLKKQQSKYSKI